MTAVKLCHGFTPVLKCLPVHSTHQPVRSFVLNIMLFLSCCAWMSGLPHIKSYFTQFKAELLSMYFDQREATSYFARVFQSDAYRVLLCTFRSSSETFLLEHAFGSVAACV